jgi:hypothetical protein
MNLTVALTGALPAVVIISAILTALVAELLLWLYRRAVVRAMNMQSGVAAAPVEAAAKPSVAGAGAFPVLAIMSSTSQSVESSTGGEAYREAMLPLRRAALVYALGGLAYAFVLTGAWMITAGGGFYLVRFLWLFSCYAWPIVLAATLILPARGVRVSSVYFAIVLIAAVAGLVFSPDLTAGQLLYFWFFANGPGTVLLLAFLNRRVRAVGPLVLAFMVAAVTGSFVIVNAFGSSDALLRGTVHAGGMLGLGATAIFIALHLVGFALFGALGWWLLRRLGLRYQAKRMSDQSITLDALWLLFGVVQSFTLVFEGWAWIFTGAVAFAAYKVVVRAGFGRLARTSGKDSASRSLLLLRVFSLGRRSQKLFDVLSQIWLRTGSISLIAGPDLVTATVEPHEFLDFVGGRLSRRFVQGETDLEARLSHLDAQPDPDGRYRVNEFFCRADTWQMTMQRLSGRSDAVLMDLRSFASNNRGCIYELRQLMNIVPLDRLILVIDGSTDRNFLETTVGEIWQNLEPESPNLELPKPAIRCFPVERQTSEEMAHLLLTLYGGQPAVKG